MNLLLNLSHTVTDNISAVEQKKTPSHICYKYFLDKQLTPNHRALIQLISQHHAQNGWIVLLAPCPLVIKLIASVRQLPLHKILVIHKKQVSQLDPVIKTALTSGHSKVVINCGPALSESEDQFNQKLAAKYSAWFYQLDNLCPGLKSH